MRDPIVSKMTLSWRNYIMISRHMHRQMRKPITEQLRRATDQLGGDLLARSGFEDEASVPEPQRTRVGQTGRFSRSHFSSLHCVQVVKAPLMKSSYKPQE